MIYSRALIPALVLTCRNDKGTFTATIDFGKTAFRNTLQIMHEVFLTYTSIKAYLKWLIKKRLVEIMADKLYTISSYGRLWLSEQSELHVGNGLNEGNLLRHVA